VIGELVRIGTDDGIELVGFYAAPPGRAARRAVLHTHGLAGNFYENRFVSTVGEAVVAKGLAFLSLNNRGHDYVSDNLKGRGRETTFVQGGATWDVFDECVFDLAAGAAFLERRGHTGICFQGHSLGTLKVVHYLDERHDPRATGVILLAPPDMFGLRNDATEGRLEDLVREGRRLVDRGEGDTLMPGSGYVVPFSARTFVSLYGAPGRTDIFPFRRGADGDYGRLARIEVPVLVAFGTLDRVAVVPAATAADIVRAKAVRSPRVEVALLPDGDHVYLGCEDALARAVAAFVEA
jgi:pimeloyl-ACP methyl ester carboxylesterase